ncbi:hypothetical protein [Nocardia sp. NPDC050717]|uniref:hypothetical protein n=1 Tax=Nocardia sp. NPDC050717 TaxID=3157221 RepID=UPI0033D2807F
MTDRIELNSHPSRHDLLEKGNSASALADVEVPQRFDRSPATLARQLEAMEAAGWVTIVAEPSGEFK